MGLLPKRTASAGANKWSPRMADQRDTTAPGGGPMKKPIIGSVPLALEQFDKLPDAAHVRLPVVCALFGISSATAWRWTRQGRLPTPQKLSPGVTTWNVGALRRLGA